MNYKKPEGFNENFFWSAATAAYQFEGAYLEDGKTLSIVDSGINPRFANTSVTSDHYHRYEEDVSLMKELGLKAYRFSISWPRILPQGSKRINPRGIVFYDKLIDLLVKNGIEPLVTIYHFDLPEALQKEYGGWSSRRIIDDFEAYCRILFESFGDRVKYWFTINEQSNMFNLPYLLVFDPSSDKSLEQQKYQMNHNMTLAHAKAVKLCHEIVKDGKIGAAIGLSPCYPASSLPEDVFAAKVCEDFKTYFFTDLYFKGEYRKNIWRYMKENNCLPEIQDGDMELLKSAKPDMLGINYYQSMTVRYVSADVEEQEVTIDQEGKKPVGVYETVPGIYQIVSNSSLKRTDWGWDIDPIGLRVLLNNMYDRYSIPMIITENGMGAVDQLEADNTVHDDYRIDYLGKHIEQIQLAINDGVEIFGYCPWSYMDLLSTTSGFVKRYGFVYVNRSDEDVKDLARYKKDSFYWYQKVIATNGHIKYE